jgi:hypothetical protein
MNNMTMYSGTDRKHATSIMNWCNCNRLTVETKHVERKQYKDNSSPESFDEFTYYTMSAVRQLCQIDKQWLRVLDRK